MNKALFYIVSFLLSMPILAGCAANNMSVLGVQGNNTVLRPIPTNALKTLPYNTEVEAIWSIKPHNYLSHIKRNNAEPFLKSAFAVSGGIVLSLDDNRILTAYHIETNKIFWQVALKFNASSLLPYLTVSNGVVVVGNDTTLYGVDIQTGASKWNRVLPDSINSPITNFGKNVIFQTDGSMFIALDSLTGALFWEHKSEKRGFSVEEASRAVTQNNIVYGLYPFGQVNAFDSTSGFVRWSRDLGSVFFNNVQDNVYAIDPVIIKDTIYLASDKDLVALKTADGTRRWGKAIPTVTNMVAVGNVLYSVGSDSVVRAINAKNGTVYWSANIGKIMSSDAINITYVHYYKGKLILFTKSGHILTLGIDTGRVIAIHKSISITMPPVNKAGKMVTLDENGILKAYK